MCKTAEGAKFDAARKNGIITVTVEWLYECIRLGRRAPVSPFAVVRTVCLFAYKKTGMRAVGMHVSLRVWVGVRSWRSSI